MANLLRLIGLALILVSGVASADQFDPVGTFGSSELAFTVCDSSRTDYIGSGLNAEACSLVMGNGEIVCGEDRGNTRYWEGFYVVRTAPPQYPNAYTCHTFGFYSSGCTAPEVPGVNGVCESIVPTDEYCQSLNVPGEGDTDGRGVANRWFITGTAPSHYCNGGCNLTVGGAVASKVGINPATGEAANWSLHEQEYAGDPSVQGKWGCTNPVDVDQEGNPESSMEHPPSNPAETPGAWSCNVATGTCVSPEGDINYCTFTGDPPERSACVPMSGDSDGDGIPNDRDSAPSDPLNGAPEEGQEGEPTSSTGGGDCITAPQNHGEAIAAQIAFQTWKTRCAVEALSKKMGTPVSGTGAYDAAIAANTLKTANASENMEKIADGSTGVSLSDMEGAMGTMPSAADAFDSGRPEDPEGTGFNDEGFLGGARTCPALTLPTIEFPEVLGGGSFELSGKFDQFCTFLGIGANMVLLFGMLASIKIYSSAFA